ncbi:GH1 family beta-glucosidase [Aliiroseovarius sp. 2305UL8-7]|uniref:GH1 family beta-glucosidase n=1 Tax=Aliiroseovarius conchicola TaxID=3121637 RepID=UPI003526FC62
MLPHRTDFPKDFLFGTATSSYQIEGHAKGGAGRTHWDDFAATPGNVAGAEDGAIACGHLDRWEQDLDLIRDGGFDVYRFSTSWARVLPDGRGTPNAAGLDFYDRLVDGMLERGIKPAATLYHWELPSALADQGGWRNRDIANWFADYTEIIMGRIGDRVWSAAPINEPWCVAWLSHFLGAHAPGLRDIRAAARAMHHVLLAHGRATEVMRGLGMSNLGAVCNMEYAAPVDDTPEAARAAAVQDAIYNRFFISGITKGKYPAEVLEGLEPHLPQGWQDDFKTITAPIDWIGVNYYTRMLYGPEITADGTPAPWPGTTGHRGDLPKTALGWEIYPEGLEHFLHMVAKEYTGDLPIYITENGMAGLTELDGKPYLDPDREAYLAAHMQVIRNTIRDGLPVKGYFTWSLMDNYEWAEGYAPRFGLVHVDFDTLKRTPKASYLALKKALQRP